MTELNRCVQMFRILLSFFSPFLIILSCGRGNGWTKISPPTPHTCSCSHTHFRERESECVQKGCGTCGHYGECWIGQVYTALGDTVSLRLRPYSISRNGTPIYLTTPHFSFFFFMPSILFLIIEVTAELTFLMNNNNNKKKLISMYYKAQSDMTVCFWVGEKHKIIAMSSQQTGVLRKQATSCQSLAVSTCYYVVLHSNPSS